MSTSSIQRTTSPATPAATNHQPTLTATTRRLLAVAVVGAPLLIAINSLFHPAVEMNGAGFLAGAEDGATTWFIVHVVAAVGALLGVAAAFGLRSLVGDGGRRLATNGLALTMIGGPLLAMGFAAEASVLRLAAVELDSSSALALAEAYAGTPEFYAIGLAVMLTTLGSLLIATGLLKSRSVPRVLPAVYLAATVAAAAGAPGTPVGPIAFGAIAAVSIALARRIARPETGSAATDDVDAA